MIKVNLHEVMVFKESDMVFATLECPANFIPVTGMILICNDEKWRITGVLSRLKRHDGGDLPEWNVRVNPVGHTKVLREGLYDIDVTYNW